MNNELTFVCSCGLRINFPGGTTRAQLRELLADHKDCAERAQTKGTDVYEEAWKAGYAKGVDAGIAIGYSDARTRTWLAVDHYVKTAGASRVGKQLIEESIQSLVGGRS